MADSLLGSRQLAAYRHTISRLLQQHPRITSSVLGFAVAVPVISHIIRSYRGFLALGPGGIPHNFLGWTIQAIAQPLARHDTRDPRPLADPRVFNLYAPHGRTSFLGDVPARRGSRPQVPTYVAPQRQMSDHSDASRVEQMQQHLADLAARQPELIHLGPSALEAPEYNALWVQRSSGLPAYLAKTTKGEIAHVHPDGSSHMILSLADAELATANGWAERHMLSGVFGFLPLTYVLVYAPRDDEELEIWKKFVVASIGFTTAAPKSA